ncbi:MAG: sigma-54 dependent transcriptional regulator [Firmicutes bacterium]|nr:sigma-54 dependent transcriptional regulator [Bacillota bacterium]
MLPQILVIDDDVEVGNFFVFFLQDEKNYPVTVANSGNAARNALRTSSFDLALVDLKLPDANGIELLKEIKATNPRCEVIIMTGYSTVKSAVEAIKLGAYDYIDKPFNELDELEATVDRALAVAFGHRDKVPAINRLAADFGMIMANNSPLTQVLAVAHKIASRNITTLVEGETGTGKEILARFIHANSHRAKNPFIGVNCSAFTETLLESELFGHEKGAFTGAGYTRRGIFEVADQGTLFLDEIGEASPSIQAKLLRVLETGELMRVGGEKPVNVNVRVIAATNVELKKAVEKGFFRQDLFYRLDVVALTLPPLRERPGDITPLIKFFMNKYLPAEERKTTAFTPAAREMLLDYAWPGNVRELSNVVARAVALRDSTNIGVNTLPDKITGYKRMKNGCRSLAPPNSDESVETVVQWWGKHLTEWLAAKGDIDLHGLTSSLNNMENEVARSIVSGALARAGGNRAAAARALNVTPRKLRYYMNERGK